MNNYSKVSIIIINWDGLKDTLECLKSLKEIDYPNYEVFVVDNGSSREEQDFLEAKIIKSEEIPQKTRLILSKENLGFSGGNNLAISRILSEDRSDFILLLNNDTIVEKYFLAELMKIAIREKEAGIFGSKIYRHDREGKKNIIHSAGSRIDFSHGSFFSVEKLDKADANNIQEPVAVDFVTGACLLIKKEVIKKIGFLDEKYFLIFEDTDWCLRAKKIGYQILYVPKSIIWHKVGQSIKKIKGLSIYYYTRNLFWFEAKYADRLQLIKFLLNYFFFIFPKYFFGYLLLKRKYDLWLNYFLGVKDGIKTFFNFSD